MSEEESVHTSNPTSKLFRGLEKDLRRRGAPPAPLSPRRTREHRVDYTALASPKEVVEDDEEDEVQPQQKSQKVAKGDGGVMRRAMQRPKPKERGNVSWVSL
jgi:hypothetical protein